MTEDGSAPAGDDGRGPAGATRRRWLRALGATGLGPASLAVPAGASPDPVPLVRTRCPDGSPGQVRTVPRERRRRLEVYASLDATAVVRRHDPVVGVGVTVRSGEDGGPALALLVERATRRLRARLPGSLAGVPAVVRERPADPEPARVCRRRIQRLYDPVVGGVAVYGKRDGDPMADGTVGPVCWDDDGSVCLLTAAHVVREGGGYADALYQEGEDDDGRHREQRVARHAAHSGPGDGGVDVAKYRVADGVRAGPLASVGREQPDVAGCWEFAGLADATLDGDVAVSFAGRSTCYGEGACVETFRSDLVDFGVRVRPEVATVGDSGGAFLDSRGRLVGLFTHRQPGENTGPAGRAALDRVGARLTPPG